MSEACAWNETHWHDLKRGDEVITIRDKLMPTFIQETVHKVEQIGDRIAVSFKNKNSRSTTYLPAIGGTHRFYVRRVK